MGFSWFHVCLDKERNRKEKRGKLSVLFFRAVKKIYVSS